MPRLGVGADRVSASDNRPALVKRIGESHVAVVGAGHHQPVFGRRRVAAVPLGAGQLQRPRPVDGLVRLRVEGHTESQGTDSHNEELSEARAASVVGYVIWSGIAPERLTPMGFGEDRLLQQGDSDDVHGTNRRVEFHIESLEGEQTSQR